MARQALMDHSKSEINGLYSIAVDDEDSVYCTSCSGSKILRCDRNGKNVQVHSFKQSKGPGYWGVAVVGDEVMVCECTTRGTILVYDRELKYI